MAVDAAPGGVMRRASALLVLALAACATPEPALQPGDALSGTRWTLTAFGGAPVGSDATLMIFDKGRLSGSDGCNRYSTTYVATANLLKVDQNIALTRMACARPIMEEAAAFIEVLTRIASYRREGDRLRLMDVDGKTLAILQPAAR